MLPQMTIVMVPVNPEMETFSTLPTRRPRTVSKVSSKSRPSGDHFSCPLAF